MESSVDKLIAQLESLLAEAKKLKRTIGDANRIPARVALHPRPRNPAKGKGVGRGNYKGIRGLLPAPRRGRPPKRVPPFSQ